MAREMVQYRGSLKSCNYSCSYCPFAKRQAGEEELRKDRESWFRFCKSMEQAGKIAGPCAVMVVPYGEALIHAYYWEGMARLSRIDFVEAVGAQTNLSFSAASMLRAFDRAGGQRGKLRIWATFHPEMVSVSHFAAQCQSLLNEGIQLCAGAVGVPENLELIRGLQKALPPQIYLWINRMDGLNRRYTPAEQAAFLEIDPLFSQELRWMKADPSMCAHRCFVEADGQTGLCNISGKTGENWYSPDGPGPAPECRRSMCTCYLAYGGRADCKNRSFFGRYPLFRIPWRPKAIFFDIDGTLIPDSRSGPVSRAWTAYLREKAQNSQLFLATSLPFEAAVQACGGAISLFSGGVFASGAHLLLFKTAGRPKQELFFQLDTSWISSVEELQNRFRCRLLLYRHGDAPYKLTLIKPRRIGWSEKERSDLSQLLPSGSVRLFAEDHCFQLVSAKADKGNGVKEICRLLGIDWAQTEAVGNSAEDLSMFRVCGYGTAAPGSAREVKIQADFTMEPLEESYLSV